MATIKPFKCIRPVKELADKVAALPYDVYNRKEAKEIVSNNSLSFLNIDRAETQFDDSVNTYDDAVYAKAKELLDRMIADGTFECDNQDFFYIYELTMNGKTQTGLVACASVDDYDNNIIKKHENTRMDKELDRIKHVDICDAQTGPIFLAYRSNQTINQILNKAKQLDPLYDFVAADGVRHSVWSIQDKNDIEAIKQTFDTINDIYIADGHHRSASAVKVSHKRREENSNYTGAEEFNYFLSILFPDEQLSILPYNRVVKDLNGYRKSEFLEKVSESFEVRQVGKEQLSPQQKAEFGMFLDGDWYRLTAKSSILSNDPVKGLDVSLLQDYLLSPILGIGDPRVDDRIDFVGGIRGLDELEKRCCEDMMVAFAMYPTSIGELFAVSDAGKLMPPKSTWFEPKPRSGLFIHKL